MRKPLLLTLSLSLMASVALAETKEIVVQAGGKPALKLTVPKEIEVKTNGNETTLQSLKLRIYIWDLPGKTVEAAVSKVGEVIKSEFVKYQVESTDAIKVAGHEAKHLKGKGEEADDNDPGTADVVVFTDGKHTFAACVHGERDEAAKERPAFLKVLESIQVQ